MLLPLTEKQKAIFNVWASFYKKEGYPPTHREVASFLGRKGNITYEARALIKKGWLLQIPDLGQRNKIPTEEALDRWKEEQSPQLKMF